MNASLNLMWQPGYVVYTEENYTKVQRGLPHVRYLYGHPIGFRINPLQTKRILLYLKTQSVPRCKHFSSRL